MVHIRARMSVLLHICCAPCSISCIEMLREEGMEPTGFWFNRIRGKNRSEIDYEG